MAAAALHFAYHDFYVHQTLGLTPAKEARLTTQSGIFAVGERAAGRELHVISHRTSPGRGGGGPARTNIDLLACSDDEVGDDFLG
jgi:hypothetical protein